MTQLCTLVSCDVLRGRVSSSVAPCVSHGTSGSLMNGTAAKPCVLPSEPPRPPLKSLSRFDFVSVSQHPGRVPCLAHSENTEL